MFFYTHIRYGVIAVQRDATAASYAALCKWRNGTIPVEATSDQLVVTYRQEPVSYSVVLEHNARIIDVIPYTRHQGRRIVCLRIRAI